MKKCNGQGFVRCKLGCEPLNKNFHEFISVRPFGGLENNFLYFGSNASFCSKLPSGLPSENFQLAVCVRGINSVGAYAELCFANVTVTPEPDILSTSSISLQSNIYRSMSEMNATGDVVQTNMVISTFASTLNSWKFVDNGTGAAYSVLGGTGSPVN